ncbi:MAG: hypothetical protein A2X19_05740 [Bacteroidetes bacterium GWE2_39_28]|nr:MAG: hypothetical protein A2X19_05740 [Bacteroidetes bacterium GWE2_39_28]OFY15155.1 MAG: hypothetical protein A2X16_08360 [Bacteroidetes bacterium GWF2_39_10]OFZ07086.1 MAG: hypothetical protein A2322_09025 [Bacteroidetes bacterium RIFOXYB2_FULL_39_7]OFZ10977.1 MAG: hypothetical protein A2465_00550 [Bacteroidetes bacterium RIFOXYC2_FULL_39_11]HCT93777.1 Asp/Glu/hydantoin racemase [Rikenellaceae bacterium]
MKSKLTLFVICIGVLFSCATNTKKIEVALSDKALNDHSSIFYASYNNYPAKLKNLPIGMFDSGTGGLTVMEQFLSVDYFDNKTGEEIPDGIPDFDGEDFIYLADQANMPYGVYSSQSKTDYLRELIIKDALFLTTEPNRTKMVVIACNTATAYGLDDVKILLGLSGTGVKPIGVIEAGVDGAMSAISPDSSNPFAVGVLATVGTISSGGYENALMKYVSDKRFKSPLKVVNQGGLGFAEAVDSETDYILRGASQPRTNYRGPGLGEFPEGIDTNLLGLYKFDTSGNSLLFSKNEKGEVENIQLNSTGNYARFHMVTLIEKHRRDNPGVKMGSVILGCTHYPFLIDTLIKVVDELRTYSQDGVNIYDEVLAEEVVFIDPAVNTAKEAFKTLFADKNLKRTTVGNTLKGYISVAHPNLSGEFKDENNNLKFEYKYGRSIGSDEQSVLVEPFSLKNINSDNLSRIKERLPYSYALIKNYLESDEF